VVFLILRFLVGRIPFAMGRLAGMMMLVQSFRPTGHPHSAHTLTAGVGLLPCLLTISVLGFAWVQSTAPMVALVLLCCSSCAAGAASLGCVPAVAGAGGLPPRRISACGIARMAIPRHLLPHSGYAIDRSHVLCWRNSAVRSRPDNPAIMTRERPRVCHGKVCIPRSSCPRSGSALFG